MLTKQRFLHETLFQARKLIAKNWMNDHIPSLSHWNCSVNISLQYKKNIYTHQGTLGNFIKYSPYSINLPYLNIV